MKKQKINKKYVKDIVKSTKDNIDIMKQYLVTTKIKNYWGDPRCDYIREIYEMLKIINIYYKDPIKLYKIKVNYKKNEHVFTISRENPLNVQIMCFLT